VKTIDLNQFIQVADMEAFGLQAIEVGIQPSSQANLAESFCLQVALSSLQNDFIPHSEFDSLYLVMQNGVGNTQESLSLGDVADIRYVPGGLLDVRADTAIDGTSVDLYVRIAGVIAKLSAADYVSLATTQALNA